MIFIILGIIAIVVGYLIIGRKISLAMAGIIGSLCAQTKGETYYDHWGHQQERTVSGLNRSRYRSLTWALVFCWPVMLWLVKIKFTTREAMDRIDPQVQALQQRRLAERIAELEAETQIKGEITGTVEDPEPPTSKIRKLQSKVGGLIK